jgi:hypothetical protein
MKHIYLAIIAFVFVLTATAQSVATFDNINLSPESFRNGSDYSGSFNSGGFTFYNLYHASWGSWSGFSVSNTTDVATPGWENQYSAITGSGNAGSANYAVCYPSPAAEIDVSIVSKISGFYVTNSTYAYWSMRNGDAFAKKFGGETGNDPDFLKLLIESLDAADNVIDSTSFYLADFRFADHSKDYILNHWTWVDLSQLKISVKLRFSMSSSDNSYGYMNTPGYFCMDDFNGEKPYVYQPVTVADFENLNLGTQGYYNGSDGVGGFTSGNFRFLTDYNADWASWSGFAASTQNDPSTAGWENQYAAITGTGVAGTPGYAVGYPSPVSTILFKDTIVSGLYVTNSAYAYWSMKNGDAFGKKFGGESGSDDDYFILTIEGFNAANQSAGKVEFFLADFTYSINSNDYILDTWKWIDLQKLGRIHRLEFSLRSSDNSYGYMNTPGYFCIDNVNRQIPTPVSAVQRLQVQVFPNPFTDRITIAGIDGTATVEIVDWSGITMARYLNVANGLTIEHLDFLKTGLYFVHVTAGSEQLTLKLLKK